MGLILDEDYNGSTLLSAWWGKVKNNFSAVKAAFDKEVSDRAEADAELLEAVESGDTLVREDIDYERTLREEADAVLAEQIGAETDARQAAIKELKSAIGLAVDSNTALNVMTDYSITYSEENENVNVYAQGAPDDMPLGLYIFSPIQDVDNIFIVSADGESELSVYSGELYADKIYIIRFNEGSGELITALENPDALKAFLDSDEYISISEIAEEFNTVYEELDNKVGKTDYASTEQYGIIKLSTSGGLELTSDDTLKVKTDVYYGTALATNGTIRTLPAVEKEIDAGTQQYKPITPSTIGYAVRSVAGKYSTAPVQIGTWIDGNPVWRVAFEMSISEEDITNGYTFFNINDICLTSSEFRILAFGGSVIYDSGAVDFIAPIEFISGNKIVWDTAQANAMVSNPMVYGYMEFVAAAENLVSE